MSKSGEDRVFLGWDNGSFIVLTDRFGEEHSLAWMVGQFGRPTTVEFRAHDEGYVSPPHKGGKTKGASDG
jgi:hypothetical protein